jgi:hypothetical protein
MAAASDSAARATAVIQRMKFRNVSRFFRQLVAEADDHARCIWSHKKGARISTFLQYRHSIIMFRMRLDHSFVVFNLECK